MSSYRLVRNDHLFFIALISTLVIASPSISNCGYFGFTKVVYDQSDQNQVNSNITSSVNIQDIPVKKIHVADPDKMVGLNLLGNLILMSILLLSIGIFQSTLNSCKSWVCISFSHSY
jgi:hypothetical protein